MTVCRFCDGNRIFTAGDGWPWMAGWLGGGVVAFEKPGGGSDLVGASKVARALADGKVPVVVLNACQSEAVAMAMACTRSRPLSSWPRSMRLCSPGTVWARRSPPGAGGCSSTTGGRARRGTCRWPTGWSRCTISARRSAFPMPARPARRRSRRWMRPWTSFAPPRRSPQGRRTRWRPSTGCSWAAMTCSISWRPPPWRSG
jgi:hypothetical protein